MLYVCSFFIISYSIFLKKGIKERKRLIAVIARKDCQDRRTQFNSYFFTNETHLQCINNIIVDVNREFSFNLTVGNRTEENGYKIEVLDSITHILTESGDVIPIISEQKTIPNSHYWGIRPDVCPDELVAVWTESIKDKENDVIYVVFPLLKCDSEYVTYFSINKPGIKVQDDVPRVAVSQWAKELMEEEKDKNEN